MLKLAAIPAVAFALAIILVPLVKRLASAYEIVALPQNDSRHRQPIPLLGGAAISGAILITVALFGDLDGWLLIATAGLFGVGLIDDTVVLRPLTKFLMQMAVVLGAVALGPPHLTLAPWPALSEALAIFWMLTTINAFNLIDGLDGLAAGVGIMAAAAIGAVGLIHGDLWMAGWGLAIIGALGAFMLWNRHPASIFMGDCGALPLGMLLGVLSLHAGGLATASRVSHYAVPILIMLVPLLDTVIVSVSRMATGIPISRRGLDHSHHRLLALGLSDQRTVALCWSIAAVAGTCAVILAATPHAYVVSVLPIIAVIFALIGLFMIDLTFDARPPGIAFGYLQGLARVILSLSYKRRLSEAALDFFIISAAYFGATLIRWDFVTNDGRVALMLKDVPLVLVSTYFGFVLAGVYRGIWRYAGMSDVLRIAYGAIVAGASILVAGKLLRMPVTPSVVAIFTLLLFNLTLASRLSFRALRKAVILLAKPGQRVLIVGAGEIAEAAARYITSGRFQYARLVGYVDGDGFKLGKMVHGYKVLGTLEELAQICDRAHFDQILVADESLAGDQMALLWAFANQRQLTVRRFSIRVNDMGAQGDASSVISEISGGIQLAKPESSGQVVA
ncbi:MAG TPA: hypothetical protein VJN94_07755 [Candidatus Binataceae bacterium]|nr:hypothetical protein [Candidatus Binataceae bacterium]